MPLQTKRALIVDDSKSARVVLSRVLEKLELAVDTTESAESALDYLRDHRPDVIFMDHLMSGMDGLQAVQAIKNDPGTASIPIMMYTSQDGELFAGEARSLGAAGVLQKLTSPGDISKVLQQLEILVDPLALKSAELEPPRLSSAGSPEAATTLIAALPATPEPASPAAAESAGAPPPAPAPLGLADVREAVEPLIRDQGADLRRFVLATIESVAAQLLTDVGRQVDTVAERAAHAAVAAVPPPPAPVVVVPPAEPLPPPRPGALSALAAFAVVAALAAGAFAWVEHGELARLRAAEAAHARAGDAAPAATRAAVAAPLATTAHMLVPYGETPLAGERLAALGKLVADLARQGYAGRIDVTTSVGDFCLTGNPAEGYAPAPADMPANRCDVVGNPFDEALAPDARVPPAVAAFAAATASRPQGAVEIVVTSATRAPSKGVYPTATEVNAAEWNAAAERLNYVEFTLEPRT
jgi:CheY-like chemotaxis protein